MLQVCVASFRTSFLLTTSYALLISNLLLTSCLLYRSVIIQLAEAMHPMAIVDHLAYVAATEAAAGAEPWVAAAGDDENPAF